MGKGFKICTGMLLVTLLQVFKTIASLATVKAKAVKRKVNCRVLATAAKSGGPYLRSESHLVDVTFMWTTKDSYSRWLSEETHEAYLSRKSCARKACCIKTSKSSQAHWLKRTPMGTSSTVTTR